MKTTTQARDPAAYAKLQEIVRDIDVAMITTVTPDGALHSRPMITREFGEDGDVWFFTADDAGMAHDLEAEHAVNVSYADPKKRSYVSITGNATIVRDPERAKQLWDESLKIYFPRGLDDPHLGLLWVRIETADLWESPAGKVSRLLHPLRHDDGNGAGGDGHTQVAVRAAPASG